MNDKDRPMPPLIAFAGALGGLAVVRWAYRTAVRVNRELEEARLRRVAEAKSATLAADATERTQMALALATGRLQGRMDTVLLRRQLKTAEWRLGHQTDGAWYIERKVNLTAEQVSKCGCLASVRLKGAFSGHSAIRKVAGAPFSHDICDRGPSG